MIALDTNILVYALDSNGRSSTAQSLINSSAMAGGLIPTQVLAEFANVCRRKLALSATEIAANIALFRNTFVVSPSTPDDLIAAALSAERYQLAFFDALICTVARAAGATFLLSEDMQDGMVIDGLRILNPFDPANAPTLAGLFAA